MEVAAERTVAGGEAGGEGGQGGQADSASLGGLYDLSSVPEELREYVETVAKQIQGNVTRSFQDHAEFRKTWEPFSQIDGLSDIPPEELSELVQFRDIAGDPATFDDWLVQVASAMSEADPDRFQAVFGQLGEATGLLGDEDDDEGGDDGQDAMLERVSQLLDERLSPIEQHLNTSSQEARVNAAREQIAGELADLSTKHEEKFGKPLDDQAQEHIKRLALSFSGEQDAIGQAYQQHLQITGQAQGELVDDKLGQPKPGVNGGRADTAPEAFSHDDPGLRNAMLQRMRAG